MKHHLKFKIKMVLVLIEGLKKLKNLIKEVGVEGEIIYHKLSGKKTENAEKALGVSREHILKSLLFKSKDRHVAAIITGNKKVDVRKLEKLIGLKKLRLATPQEVKAFTGFEIGGVPPFIFYKLCPTYVDKEVMEKEYVIGAAGSEYYGIRFSPKIFRKLGYIVEEIGKNM